MDKVCKEFDVDFDYFRDFTQVNNVNKNKGTIANSVGTINNCPVSIIEQVKLLVEENATLKKEVKAKDQKIAQLEKKLDL